MKFIQGAHFYIKVEIEYEREGGFTVIVARWIYDRYGHMFERTKTLFWEVN